MYLDAQLIFSDSQVITATANSTNLIDMGSLYDNGPGESLLVAIGIPVAFNTLTSLTFELKCDNDIAFGSPRILLTRSLTLAELTLGVVSSIPVPQEKVERYLRMTYTVVGANPTLGAIDAWLTNSDGVTRQVAFA